MRDVMTSDKAQCCNRLIKTVETEAMHLPLPTELWYMA